MGYVLFYIFRGPTLPVLVAVPLPRSAGGALSA